MVDTSRILVTGGQGRLGTALAARGCRVSGRSELNILDTESIARRLGDVQPQLVINAAAYTAVDQAETETKQAYAINGDGAGWLADACQAANIPVLHISTDCVFGDADPAAPKREDETPNPLSVYGASKLEGEHQVNREGNVIARVAWLFDKGPETFIGKMLKVAKGRDSLSIVDDEWGRPTSVSALADHLVKLADLMIAGSEPVPSLLHLGPPNPASRYDWAHRIFAESARLGGPAPALSRVGADAFPTPARRPRGLILDVSLADSLMGPMPPWGAYSDAAVADLI